MSSKDFILASSSAIRISILEKYSIPFKHLRPTCNEDELKENNRHLSPTDLSTFLAKEKALSISKDHQDALVLGCDQICLFHTKIFEKPGTRDNAINNLKELRSNEHLLIGSYVFVKNDEVISSKLIKTSMIMRNLTDQEINAYVDEDKPFNSCGS